MTVPHGRRVAQTEVVFGRKVDNIAARTHGDVSAVITIHRGFRDGRIAAIGFLQQQHQRSLLLLAYVAKCVGLESGEYLIEEGTANGQVPAQQIERSNAGWHRWRQVQRHRMPNVSVPEREFRMGGMVPPGQQFETHSFPLMALNAALPCSVHCGGCGDVAIALASSNVSIAIRDNFSALRVCTSSDGWW